MLKMVAKTIASKTKKTKEKDTVKEYKAILVDFSKLFKDTSDFLEEIECILIESESTLIKDDIDDNYNVSVLKRRLEKYREQFTNSWKKLTKPT